MEAGARSLRRVMARLRPIGDLQDLPKVHTFCAHHTGRSSETVQGCGKVPVFPS
jgi:hypothetical protein